MFGISLLIIFVQIVLKELSKTLNKILAEIPKYQKHQNTKNTKIPKYQNLVVYKNSGIELNGTIILT